MVKRSLLLPEPAEPESLQKQEESENRDQAEAADCTQWCYRLGECPALKLLQQAMKEMKSCTCLYNMNKK